MHIARSLGPVIGGTLLVAGSSIGLGMLALPLTTAAGGFFPAIVMFLIAWAFMVSSGLLVLEAALWLPKDANLISMAEGLLGKKGKVFCWVLYLFLFVSLLIAHAAGGGGIFVQLSGETLSYPAGVILYMLLFSPVIWLGVRAVDGLNRLLVFGAVVTYLFFVIFAFSFIHSDLLFRSNFLKSWLALPIVVTAFGYQNLIPTLLNYMDRNARKVKIAIFCGTSIPLVIYLIWELIILGIVPYEGLLASQTNGDSAVVPLGNAIGRSMIFDVGKVFSFFVLTTSFLGMAIAFIDFLADGLRVKKQGWNRWGLCFLTLGIPTLIALVDPTLFLKALGFAGGTGAALLFGIMPVMMVWVGRYQRRLHPATRQLPGGKSILCLILFFWLSELFIELCL